MNLRDAAQQALEALEKEPADFSDWLRTMKAARTALSAALTETASQEFRQVEPVAWITPGQELHLVNYERFQDWTPLYTAPPKREPLTVGQLFDLYNENAKCQEEDWLVSGWLAFAAAIERAHGIGGEE